MGRVCGVADVHVADVDTLDSDMGFVEKSTGDRSYCLLNSLLRNLTGSMLKEGRMLPR